MSIRLKLPKIGQVIDGYYRIDKKIKGGTYGMVYRGEDIRTGETVAIKVLLPSAASNIAVIQRFEREVQVISELSHPNIIEIFNAGLSPEGCLYYAMEFLVGSDLGGRLKKGKLPIKGASLITIQALMALEEAHNHDIIHRDLKPENIFLQSLEGRKVRIRVLDFGIAKVIGERGEALPRLTLQNEACGTPSYMAPEQIIGDEITASTDLYAMGLLLFEMLAGKMAVKGDSFVETLRLQISDPIILPPELAQGALADVLERALQKDTRLRYQSAREMRKDIEKVFRSNIS